MAFIAAYAIGDGPQVWAMPLHPLLALADRLDLTRPASRRVFVVPQVGTL